MGFIETIRGWIGKVYGYLFDKYIAVAKKDFDITPLNTAEVDTVISDCGRAYMGNPPWVNREDGIATTSFATIISQEVARLATLAIGIKIDGGPRAEWLQERIDEIYFRLRHWVEYGCGYGTIILKVGGEGEVSVMTPSSFLPTDQSNGRITGAVFRDEAKVGDKYYTRLEYHRFEDQATEVNDDDHNGQMDDTTKTVRQEDMGQDVKEDDDRVYVVSNIAYMSSTEDSIGERIPLDRSPWDNLEDEVRLLHLEKPLFAVFRMPNANNVDIDSPYGLPVFASAMEELKDLDIAYSRNAKEIFDSKRTVMIDSDKLLMSGVAIGRVSMEDRVKSYGLPDYVKAVSAGSSRESLYQEINPTLNTDVRLTGINHLLSQIGYKCGFSNGYFVMDEKTGMMTATQVESDDRRTIQLIKDVRGQLEECLDSLIYVLDVYADLYELAPEGAYRGFRFQNSACR